LSVAQPFIAHIFRNYR